MTKYVFDMLSFSRSFCYFENLRLFCILAKMKATLYFKIPTPNLLLHPVRGNKELTADKKIAHFISLEFVACIVTY